MKYNNIVPIELRETLEDNYDPNQDEEEDQCVYSGEPKVKNTDGL